MSSACSYFSLLCGILLFAGSASAQNLLTNGSFESPAFSPNSVNSPDPIPGWTSTGGFEVWNQFQGPAADGNQYLELDVSTCTTISQTIPTNAAINYVVSLAFAARDGVADNRIEVLWNGTVIGSASADGSAQSGNVAWTHYTFPAQAGGAGSSTLQIRNVDTCDGLGSLLDDVAVVRAPVPTPLLGRAGIVLLAGGLMLLALILLRRRAA
ncbi:MAG TPA: DUF642 domain-containing protein [Rudaea sp.]|nr:DUF642 domain-containing protein [Rudaea sp.]